MMTGKVKDKQLGPKMMIGNLDDSRRMEKRPSPAPVQKQDSGSDDNYDDSDGFEEGEEVKVDIRKKMAKEGARALAVQKKRQEDGMGRASPNQSVLK
jgi:hypothetical protein